jgi:putative Mn2+ efflux pump MntP
MSNISTIENYKRKTIMNLGDLRLYMINSVALAVSITNVEVAMKLILLGISIVYTVMKIIDLKTNKKNKNEEL